MLNEREQRILEVLHGASEGLISVQELLGFDDENAEAMYQSALGAFERGSTSQAEQLLGWLVGAKPYVAKYWTAYGGTLQVREAFLDAIRAYTTALAIDDDEIVARANRGEACLMAGLVERGLDDLKTAANTTNVPDDLRGFVTRARRLIELHEEAERI